MGLQSEISAAVRDIFKTQWSERAGQVVPESEDIQLGNHGVNIEAAILYADLENSTQLVDFHSKTFAAECYKSFLHCATKISNHPPAKPGAFVL
jgi:class 3 adenylate cyclase